MTDDEARAFVKTLYGALNDHDTEALDTLFADDYLDHQEGSTGVEALKAQLEGFWAGFSDLHIEVDDVVASEQGFASRTTVTGTHDGELMGMPATGTKVSVTAVDIARVVNGRAVERWGGLDRFSLLSQLGVIPSPQPA